MLRHQSLRSPRRASVLFRMHQLGMLRLLRSCGRACRQRRLHGRGQRTPRPVAIAPPVEGLARKVMPMRVPIALPICCTLFLALSGPAAAEPKGANGETCDSSETNVKHEIKGTQYVCDKCVYSTCDTNGGQISNCRVVTHWSNCVAAAGTSGAGVKATTNGELSPQTDTEVKAVKPPKVNAPGKSAQ